MAKPKVISLNKVVSDLDATREDLERALGKAEGRAKKDLALKIRKLKSIRRELTMLCRNAFMVYPPSPR